MFEYRASVTRVVDGDTVWLRVDLGFRMWFEAPFRLVGIDAPELGGASAKDGAAAREFLEWLLEQHQTIRIESAKPDKYGRYLATLYLPDGTNVNAAMIAAGHAVPYMV